MNRRTVHLLIAMLTLALSAGAVWSQIPADVMPKEWENTGITQNLDAQLPLDAVLTDSSGQQVKLGDYFDDGKPVLMALVYYRCPALCGVVLNGMFDSVKEMSWTPGDEYEIVVISFDAREDAGLADIKRRAYLNDLGREGAEEGVHFLVGDEATLDHLCKVVGFGYAWNEDTKEYVHSGATYVVTPKGRMSKYFIDLIPDPRTLRLSMVEASAGTIGSFVDRIAIRCSHVDPFTGAYTVSAMKIMKLTAPGVGAAILLVVAVSVLRHRNHAA